MTYSPAIYDWPTSVQPVNQVFRAGGVAVQGGMTLGGASIESPEPGGRGELMLEFSPFADADVNRQASWLASRILNGNVMRIKLFSPTVQIVADSVFVGSTSTGVTWSNNLGWSTANWAFDPMVPILNGGTKGQTQIKADLSGLNKALQVGHVFGLREDGFDFVHIVTNVTYVAGNATIDFMPPLRRQVTSADYLRFRPVMLAVCVNAREVMGNFRYGTTMAFNPARFVEALV